jgi:hypothetical protein
MRDSLGKVWRMRAHRIGGVTARRRIWSKAATTFVSEEGLQWPAMTRGRVLQPQKRERDDVCLNLKKREKWCPVAALTEKGWRQLHSSQILVSWGGSALGVDEMASGEEIVIEVEFLGKKMNTQRKRWERRWWQRGEQHLWGSSTR